MDTIAKDFKLSLKVVPVIGPQILDNIYNDNGKTIGRVGGVILKYLI